MQQPGRHGTGDAVEWVLVVTFVSEKNVGVNFSRSESGDLADSYENEPYTLIPVGSSAEVLGCTITVLESHPKRPSGHGDGSANSSALIAVQCSEGGAPTATPDPTAQDEASVTATSAESPSGSDVTATANSPSLPDDSATP
ncbi:hypothetical protein [Actinomyces glycerinitolerans]|uniref:Uncharacterized protein n=1 Tax=Actinomyces glycerinitolerans TaxID=1892869 RepID=A0A1M4RWJ1_9ACTO|nr:hypothetical protein [Actinomyces glycerinitolerans]SHE24328.1 Hypothetical protein ACGLYG10_0529 [Actinomyces glycerinitolerans]